MKVIWAGSFESKQGKEKITLDVPEGSEDELYALKKSVRNGKEIMLIELSTDIPAYEFDQIIPICRMIEDSRNQEYRRGLREAAEAMEETLLKEGG
jgi:hypothetical protein